MLIAPMAAGLGALLDYLSAHVITCLVPAFFIAGAIAAVLSKEAILKYFGAGAKKWLSYSAASVSGTILAVCSCTILPMFAGIYKRGAGIGPAITFLFSGPAINLLAIVFTASVLGLGLGIARAVGAISMSIIIGLIMAAIFRETKESGARMPAAAPVNPEQSSKRPWFISLAFFVLLVAILLVAAVSSELLPWTPKLAVIYFLTVAVAVLLIFYYTKDEVKAWAHETGWLAKMIFPILLVGVFITGIIGYFMPYDLVKQVVGGNSVLSCFIASVIGAVLYMPTLLEVPIVGTLFGYSQGVIGGGPALALLLAGPSLSLPSMLVIWRTIGWKKAGVYIALVVISSTFLGFVYGGVIG
jgi:hypothetical protein